MRRHYSIAYTFVAVVGVFNRERSLGKTPLCTCCPLVCGVQQLRSSFSSFYFSAFDASAVFPGPARNRDDGSALLMCAVCPGWSRSPCTKAAGLTRFGARLARAYRRLACSRPLLWPSSPRTYGRDLPRAVFALRDFLFLARLQRSLALGFKADVLERLGGASSLYFRQEDSQAVQEGGRRTARFFPDRRNVAAGAGNFLVMVKMTNTLLLFCLPL